MKKTIIVAIFFILLGALSGRFLYYKLEGVETTFNNQDVYYFLQEGVYSNEDIMNENTKKLNSKLITSSDNKYYVYLGITKNLDNAKKIEKLYEDEGYDIYLKELSFSNEEFSANVEQFDKLIENTSDLDDILTIEEVVLSNYEEIMRKDK